MVHEFEFFGYPEGGKRTDEILDGQQLRRKYGLIQHPGQVFPEVQDRPPVGEYNRQIPGLYLLPDNPFSKFFQEWFHVDTKLSKNQREKRIPGRGGKGW